MAAGCIGCGSGCLAGAVSLAEMIFSSISRFPLSPVGADPPPMNKFIYGKPDFFYFAARGIFKLQYMMILLPAGS